MFSIDYQLFLGGCVFLFVGYLIYRFFLKGVKHSLEDVNEDGMTPSSYVGLWGSVVIGVVLGIIFILKSLPFHID